MHLAIARRSGTIDPSPDPRPPMRPTALPVALLFLAASCAAQQIEVRVERNGDAVVVDVDAQMPGSLRDAWAVFTDYENMASFISNLTASKVLAKKDHSLEVMQAGSTQVGFMTFGFQAVRAVELVPMHEIRSSLVSGDFKAYTSTTSLSPAGGGTRVRHHGEYVPKSWLPPLVGPAIIERETKKQYREFAAEIERRSAAQR
jgi:ribosome-associated toxin RatA of RatAB toxin-antitoxin module